MTEIHYDEKGYIMLGGIEVQDLPDTLSVDGYELLKKDEFHITLVGSKALTYLPEDIDRAQVMKEAVAEFMQDHDFAEYEILDEYRLVKREDRVTVVAMARVADMEALYAFLNNKFDIALPTQPAHVTIYTLTQNVGISINSAEQLEADTKLIDLPKLAS